MTTAILILNWNGGDDTIHCLSSLLPHTGPQDYIFVTDNGSTDASVQQLTDYFTAAQLPVKKCTADDLKNTFDPAQRFYLVTNASNLGFGGGNNTVLKQLPLLSLKFELAWLLNNDALVNEKTLAALKSSFLKDDSIAVAGSLILNYPGTDSIQCAGVNYYKFLGVSKLIHKNLPYAQLNKQEHIDFDYLNGASLMFKTGALEKAGYFDERFFLYSEEFDLQLRIQELNYTLDLCLDSLVFHKLSGGTSKNRHLFYYYYNMSAVLLSKKHYAFFTSVCAIFNLTLITFIRTFPSVKNFSWGLKGVLKGIKK